jgi:hypothetical protein
MVTLTISLGDTVATFDIDDSDRERDVIITLDGKEVTLTLADFLNRNFYSKKE